MQKSRLRRFVLFIILVCTTLLVLVRLFDYTVILFPRHANTERNIKNEFDTFSLDITTQFQDKIHGYQSKLSTTFGNGNNFKRNISFSPGETSPVNFTLPKFDIARPLVFLHIGKSGGNAFDRTIAPIMKELNGVYIGFRHFDWSYITTIHKADVAVILREPVSRAISHYYFMRKWSKNELNQEALSIYLQSNKAMLHTRDCWFDGQASISWLTGTHTANWVGILEKHVLRRERMSLNVSRMCLLAARRLESTFWFGILEDMERSLELLQYQLGLTKKIHLQVENVNIYPRATENETRILTSLMPQDIWLYEYAKLLFEARWIYYKTGIYRHPNTPFLPTLESVPCISTRFIMLCRKGPLSPLYYVTSDSSVEGKYLPNDIIKELKLDRQFLEKTRDFKSEM